MNERYELGVRSSELLIRNTIIQKMVAGWGMAPSPRLLVSVASADRIGNGPTTVPHRGDVLFLSQEIPAVAPRAEPRPAESIIATPDPAQSNSNEIP